MFVILDYEFVLAGLPLLSVCLYCFWFTRTVVLVNLVLYTF